MSYSVPHRRQPGFALAELMVATTIAVGISLIAFRMFEQNERVFRDQNLVLEMRQSLRAVTSLIGGEIRLAGQGVPVYAGRFGGPTSEAVQTFLNRTGATTILFRAGIRNGVVTVTDAINPTSPLSLAGGSPVTIGVSSTAPLRAIIGANTDRFVYLWGMSLQEWTWVRARLTRLDSATNQVTVVPAQISPLGGQFDAPPHLGLEEAIGYALVQGSIIRSESTGFTDETSPLTIRSSVGNNFAALRFEYRDGMENAVDPSTPAGRTAIRGVVLTVVARTAQPLASTGTVRTEGLSMTVYPPNLR